MNTVAMIPEEIDVEAPDRLAELDAYDRTLARDAVFRSNELSPTPIETRAEIPSLALLHHKRRQILRELAGLDALFAGGQNTNADARRKQHRHLIMTEIQTAELEKSNGKGDEKSTAKPLAENALERLANIHPRHIEYCDALEAKRVQWVLLKNAVTEITELIRSRELELLAYTAEAKLQR